MVVYVKKFSGKIMEWPCVLDLEDNEKIRYVSKVGDLNEIGMYLAQPKVTQQTWGPLKSDTAKFHVLGDFTR